MIVAEVRPEDVPELLDGRDIQAFAEGGRLDIEVGYVDGNTDDWVVFLGDGEGTVEFHDLSREGMRELADRLLLALRLTEGGGVDG